MHPIHTTFYFDDHTPSSDSLFYVPRVGEKVLITPYGATRPGMFEVVRVLWDMQPTAQDAFPDVRQCVDVYLKKRKGGDADVD